MTIRVVDYSLALVGLGSALKDPGSSRKSDFKVVWSNQWEPNTKKQHAAEVYVNKWKQNPPKLIHWSFMEMKRYSSTMISQKSSPIYSDHDLLVGGFPCQDYSVARTKKHATGIEGKKGVLWWEIMRIVNHKRPPVLLLENVDGLLKSPSYQRGRDFAVMLTSLSELDYVVR